ncbi:MAG TPA: site-specific integrase [Terriglobales bacterium]|nr:site-specific integrase [Terriglobales bacterium]
MKRTQQDVGTIIRKKKARGLDIWVWRFYEVDETGVTRKRSVMLAGDAEEWPTEAHAWQGSRDFRYQRMEQSCGQSFGALVKRYMHEAMPERYSTKKSYASILKRHILPQWGNAPLAEVKKPFKVERWLKDLKHSPKTKSNIKGLLHRIFEYAMKWEILETQRNPMQLVEIKGVTKRIRKKIVLTVEQYHALLAELPYHIQVMGMIAMCLGLRVSEIRALQWQDFDLKRRILTLARSIVGKYVWNGGKTGASEDEVALDSKLVSVLEDWQKRCVPTPEGWLFANADTRRPVHGDVIQKDYLRPAGEKVGLLGVGWHTFRHTYRTLIDDVGTPLGVQQRLMRHADIKTTMNTYGSAFERSKRRANSRVAALVLPPAIKRQLKDRAKEVALQNLKPETAAIQ